MQIYFFALLYLSFVFQAFVGLSNILPHNIDWIRQGDSGWPYLGLQFFYKEPWNWPPFFFHSVNGPAAYSLGNLDPVPWLAYLTKLIAWPQGWQYFGIWYFACLFLLWFFSFKILRLRHSPSLSFTGACLVSLAPFFYARHGHTALMGQFTLLWAFWLALNKRLSKNTLIAQILVLQAFVSGVQPYLSAMCLALNLGICFFHPSLKSLDSWKRLPLAAALLLLSFSVFWFSGYLSLPKLDEIGFGYYASDLLAFINPLQSSRILPYLKHSEAFYEGYAYLGLGVLLLAVFLGFKSRSLKGQAVSPLIPRWLWSLSFLMALYALAPAFRFGSNALLPDSEAALESLGLSKLLNLFRTNGRFIWPLAYLLSLQIVFLTGRLKGAKWFLLAAIGLQFYETSWFKWPALYQKQQVPQFSSGKLGPLPRQISTLITVPYSGYCYKNFVWGMTDHSFDLALLALQNSWDFASIPAARFDREELKNRCRKLERDLQAGVGEPQTLYALTPEYQGAELPGNFSCQVVGAVSFCYLNNSP